MKQLQDILKLGNWKSLLACFMYFDTGFTLWVMLGPLAPYISKTLGLSVADQGFLVAIPVLSAAILRIAMGSLYQAMPGRTLALLGVALSAIPSLCIGLGPAPSLNEMVLLGVFLGFGGASFAVALPMAGSSYPSRVQGLVLGLAAAGNIGAVLDGFLFPSLAAHWGWSRATLAVLPLLALTAWALWAWADDRHPKSGSQRQGMVVLLSVMLGLLVLISVVRMGWLGGSVGKLLLPILGSAWALSILPPAYRHVLLEKDAWFIMLIYAVTFGGFVGMSSYISVLLTSLYHLSKVDAGMIMAGMAFTGAILRPIGGGLADRISGVRALAVLLSCIALLDGIYAVVMPGLMGGLILLFSLYACFGLGNGATFQLVPKRWVGRTGLMTGIIGCAGGVGGFYLPVIMSMTRQASGSYSTGFMAFAVIAALAACIIMVLRREWLVWAQGTDASMNIPDTKLITAVMDAG